LGVISLIKSKARSDGVKLGSVPVTELDATCRYRWQRYGVFGGGGGQGRRLGASGLRLCSWVPGKAVAQPVRPSRPRGSWSTSFRALSREYERPSLEAKGWENLGVSRHIGLERGDAFFLNHLGW